MSNANLMFAPSSRINLHPTAVSGDIYKLYLFASSIILVLPNLLSLRGYIKTDGSAWGWGYNNHGQLGDNSIVNKSTPVAVYGSKTFCQISAGYAHSLAVDKNGQAWGWGYNQYGQLGDNSLLISQLTPVAVYGSKTFCQISGGQSHSLALDYNGKVWGWGYNNVGQLGDNSVTNRSTPVAVCGAHTFCQISGGYFYSLALDYNGKAWSWGINTYGQLGNNELGVNQSTPVAVCGAHTFCKISGGSLHSVAIDRNGKAWSWGSNSTGQLGYSPNTKTPVAVCI